MKAIRSDPATASPNNLTSKRRSNARGGSSRACLRGPIMGTIAADWRRKVGTGFNGKVAREPHQKSRPARHRQAAARHAGA